MAEPHDLTRWLEALQAGDSAALDEIVRVLYDELRNSADFGGGTLTSNGAGDLFVARYDPGGSHLSSFNLGGSSSDRAHGVSFDGDGNLAVAETFQSSSIDLGGGPFALSAMFSTDWFLAVFDGRDNHMHSASFAGQGYSIRPSFDSSGRLLLSGGGGDCGLGDSYGIYRGDLALGYGSLAMDSCDVDVDQRAP